MERTTRSFRFDQVSPRRATFLSLAGEIGSQLRDAYDERYRNHGVTQATIARTLGVNRSAVNHRLRGLVNMTIETLADMVWALGYAIKITIYDPAKVGENTSVFEVTIPAAPKKWPSISAAGANTTLNVKTAAPDHRIEKYSATSAATATLDTYPDMGVYSSASGAFCVSIPTSQLHRRAAVPWRDTLPRVLQRVPVRVTAAHL